MNTNSGQSLSTFTSGSAGALVPLPAPRCAVSVRLAEASDVGFIDSLQKMHSHMVGFMPGKQIEKYVADGNVLIAEEPGNGPPQQAMGNGKTGIAPCAPIAHSPLPIARPVGYCMAKDQYLKRDDLGIIYQLNVLPLKQRHLVGASLVKATFEKAAYGCKLFCCWCAQDIQANWFWESIGFVPLAFRTGSRAKQRIHIFWEKRIREGDETTPYWFPSQTSGGAVAEDRLVLPIPPDTHWRDAKPLILPGMLEAKAEDELPKTLPGGALVKPRPDTGGQPKASRAQRAAIARSKSKHLGGVPPGQAAVVTAGGIRYIERGDYVPEPEPAKPKRARKPRQKNDPKFIAAARDLRDRYLEQVNTPGSMLLPGGGACGKYDVSRQLEASPIWGAGAELKQTPLLDAA